MIMTPQITSENYSLVHMTLTSIHVINKKKSSWVSRKKQWATRKTATEICKNSYYNKSV